MSTSYFNVVFMFLEKYKYIKKYLTQGFHFLSVFDLDKLKSLVKDLKTHPLLHSSDRTSEEFQTPW